MLTLCRCQYEALVAMSIHSIEIIRKQRSSIFPLLNIFFTSQASEKYVPLKKSSPLKKYSPLIYYNYTFIHILHISSQCVTRLVQTIVQPTAITHSHIQKKNSLRTHFFWYFDFVKYRKETKRIWFVSNFLGS